MLRIEEKLNILADAAKYDVSCSSSGSKRQNVGKGLGNSDGVGICHSYTEDGRCVSLLKILLTNHCIFDCAYCVTRRSNDIKRAAFTVQEVVDLTINFYRRNFIEGLFLSSGIFKNADYTMERLVRVAKKLRTEHNFNGYIHLKTIPGASEELIKEAGLYADRLSVNIELPTDASLQQLAPEKSLKQALTPMGNISKLIIQHREEKKQLKHAPAFAAGGQSTQLIVGASPENDAQILGLASQLYKGQQLKRVYYSAYIPVSADNRLPVISTPPVVRENRLYQADWLMRYYQFEAAELVNASMPQLDLAIDPKLNWALRNRQFFPLDINKADYEMLIRVPGLGLKSAKLIVEARRFARVTLELAAKMGVSMNKARHFITDGSRASRTGLIDSQRLRQQLVAASPRTAQFIKQTQLPLF